MQLLYDSLLYCLEEGRCQLLVVVADRVCELLTDHSHEVLLGFECHVIVWGYLCYPLTKLRGRVAGVQVVVVVLSQHGGSHILCKIKSGQCYLK